jgi:tol-pal system protein YbgF
MLRTPTCLACLISLSLFGGLAFADAPIATINNNGTPVAQVVNSQALLSSLTPDQRIARLENQVQYLSTYNNQLQSLSTQVDILRGKMEDLSHQVQLLQNQLKTQSAPTSTPAPTTTATTATISDVTANAPSSISPEQTAFNQAYTLMTQKKYPQATAAYTQFLAKYPKSTQASTAHYWLGDLYLAQGMPDKAAKQYKVTANIVNAPKRPEAMLQLGTILLAYGDNTHAEQLFKVVIKNYPNSSYARQARKHLQSLSS